ncbi:hypothetical protein EZMO1_2513 [Endozoicomonas montiporae CL-33]|uniref:Uncharacterized protein n=1 Tax=Endozoicomonas montiporae CL-33 TaxID=570277 RepID=A0A142BCW8_9GAMM|nr:hypothetical protein EZMO1_2513 [Endozoicomonas montiporae CL-33]
MFSGFTMRFEKASTEARIAVPVLSVSVLVISD